MQKYGAPCTWNNGLHIVADNDCEIVYLVMTPHLLCPGRVRQGNEAIIFGVCRVVDPSITR